MRILLTGATGQVGFELSGSLALLGQTIAPTRDQFDLSKPGQIARSLDEYQPDLVINPGAYTAVDRAQEEPELAYAVNRDAPAAIAQWCQQNNAALVHYSTDYVYSGRGQTPFIETEPGEPTGVYGASKLAGDLAVLDSGASALIFRTSWVYGARGGNFLNTMLRLADSTDTLRVVDDQIGAPTSSRLIADVTMAVLMRHGASPQKIEPIAGVYHLVPGGFVSWHGFAARIMQERATLTGLAPPEVTAISTSEFPTAADRPANSRLSTEKLSAVLGLSLPDWDACLQQVMRQRLSV